MIVTTNYVEVNRRLRTSSIQTWFGGLLLLGSVLTFLLPIFFASLLDKGIASTITIVLGYPLLLLGLLLFKRGQFNRRRYKGLGRIRPDQEQIERELAELPARYNLFNYVNLGTLSIDHLLVTPKGVLIITAKPHTGTISAAGDRWRRRLGVFGFMTVFGEPGLGDPSREIANLVKKTREWFAEHGFELPTDGLITFTAPKRDVNPGGLGVKLGPFESMSFPALPVHELRAAVRGWDTDTRLSGEQQATLEKVISEQMPRQDDNPDAVRDLRPSAAGAGAGASVTAVTRKGSAATAAPVNHYALKQQRKEEKLRRLRYGSDPLGQPEKLVPYRKPLADGTVIASTAKGTKPNPETLEAKQRNKTKAPARVTTVELPSALAPTATTAQTNPASLQGGKNEPAERRRKS